jgi:hypothetical protein
LRWDQAARDHQRSKLQKHNQMRQVINGYGADSTAATLAYLQANNVFRLCNLYLIGYPEDPNALWLTDYESPLQWPVWGDAPFLNAAIKRGTVSTKVGLAVQTLQITWTPKNAAYGYTTATSNPWQLAQAGYYDNVPVRVWSCYMPAPGDAMTYGCSALFGGRIGQCKIIRGNIVFSVTSFLDVVNQMVPTNVIEMYSQSAAYSGATPPAGFSVIPQFVVAVSASDTVIVGDCTNIGPHHQFGTNVLRGGYLVFNAGGTLGPSNWSAIQENVGITIGSENYLNQFVLYTPLPFPPSVGDTFSVSAPAPVDQSDDPEAFDGFLYVPSPALGAS